MFTSLLLVCVLGTDKCELMKRTDNKTYPTMEQCLEATAVDAKQVYEYLAAKGVYTQVGFKCEEDKNSI
jgi:hypothetical protein